MKPLTSAMIQVHTDSAEFLQVFGESTTPTPETFLRLPHLFHCFAMNAVPSYVQTTAPAELAFSQQIRPHAYARDKALDAAESAYQDAMEPHREALAKSHAYVQTFRQAMDANEAAYQATVQALRHTYAEAITEPIKDLQTARAYAFCTLWSQQ